MPLIFKSALKKGVGGGEATGDSDGVTEGVGVRERETPAGMADVVDVNDREGVTEGVGLFEGIIGVVDGVPETVGVCVGEGDELGVADGDADIIVSSAHVFLPPADTAFHDAPAAPNAEIANTSAGAETNDEFVRPKERAASTVSAVAAAGEDGALLPSCPSELSPKQTNLPLLERTHVWKSPAVTDSHTSP